LYDMVINTAFFNEEMAVDVICQAAAEKKRNDDEKQIPEKLREWLSLRESRVPSESK